MIEVYFLLIYKKYMNCLLWKRQWWKTYSLQQSHNTLFRTGKFLVDALRHEKDCSFPIYIIFNAKVRLKYNLL